MSDVVLITGVGGDISQGVATILRECRPEIRVIGVDMHGQHGGHRYVDFFTIVPAAGDPAYRDALKSVAEQQGANLVIPMSEAELNVLRPFPRLGPDIAWLFAGNQVVDAGLDKLETARVLSGLGVPVPWTVPVADGAVSYPCILKSRYGSGSRAVFLVKDADDARYLVPRYPEAVFQELLLPAEREVTCAVYRNKQGEVKSLLMQRRLSGGFTSWARVIENAESAEMCRKIASGLDLRGSMNVQLRLTDKGPRVFEINPRFSSTVLMRHRMGFTDVLWALDEADGRLIEFPELPSNQVLVRVHDAMVFAASQ
jgi:carbamoyl-phosphate synthase large subunit